VAESVNRSVHQDLSELFHRLNNELGVILSHAELLEAKCDGDKNRSRAAQVVTAALEAMGTVRQIRSQINGAAPGR
jgi:hypothetical protein